MDERKCGKIERGSVGCVAEGEEWRSCWLKEEEKKERKGGNNGVKMKEKGESGQRKEKCQFDTK